ncbi:MAG: DUF167 domain-containing protein [Chloroflexi bacterium]|nr:DUF167 domain-containing protein [Chloroflexota bacterium]
MGEGDRAYLRVHVRPAARRDEVVALAEGVLRVQVKAPPERGLANRAVEALLAEVLDLLPSKVRVVRGVTSRDKLVAVEGLSSQEAWSKVGQFLMRGD